jgi:hypothetical protein
MKILDIFHKTISTIFLVNFFQQLNRSPIAYKIGITLYLIFLMVIVKMLIQKLFPTNNAFLVSSIIVWIQMLLIVIVVFCDTKSNALTKSVY